MQAEVQRQNINPKFQRALAQLDAAAGITDYPPEGVYASTASLVNYAKAPIGAKKYEASTLTGGGPRAG